MTYEEALNIKFEGRTLKEIYKTERQFIRLIYEEKGTPEVKRAIEIIEAYLEALKRK